MFDFRQLQVPHDIRFYDAEDLRYICTYPLAQQKPGTLCAATQSTILYVDESKRLREVYWLDLSDGKPKPASGKCVIHTENTTINDMCFVQDGDKQLLIVAAGDRGVFAYDTENDKVEWKVGENLSGNEKHIKAMGITTDGRGHLFVTDHNNHCIQMFSVSDGKYLGYLILDSKMIPSRSFITWPRKENFRPHEILWCEEMSSLVCTCRFDGSWNFMVINVEY